MPRLLRHEKKAQTRNGLLETARRVFIEQGYHNTTLDQVAEAAGFSKGAVYSNFKSKGDLFLALLDELMEERLRELSVQLEAAQRAPDFLGELARQAVGRRMKQAPQWTLLLMEFWTHAAREQQVRRQFAARHRQFMQKVARQVDQVAAQRGISPRRRPIDVMRAISAIGHGMAMEELIEPGSVKKEFLAELFVLIYRDSAVMGKLTRRRAGKVQSTTDLREAQPAHMEGES